MTLRLVVIGAGAAGSAAAWCAARRGAQVTIVSDRAGSSALSSGALDFDYDATESGPLRLEPEVPAFVAALGCWQLGDARVATRQGVVRPVRGLDRALLNLEPLAGLRIAVCDVDRDDWDAPALARSLAASPWARRTGTEFVSVPVAARRQGPERRIAAYDFALLHDHPERLAWLGGLLREARVSADAWLLGPWLGTAPSVAERLREHVGRPLGEVSSGLAGPAGARFERARDRLLDELSVARETLHVVRIERAGTQWRIFGEQAELTADAVVVAVGGVAAGGVRLKETMGRGPGGFGLAFELPARVVLDGDVAGETSSLFGPRFETLGLGALERVGLELTAEGLLRSADGGPLPAISAAGDCVAGRPRSLLEAVRSGCAAIKALLPSV